MVTAAGCPTALSHCVHCTSTPPPLQVANASSSEGHRFKLVGVVLATRFVSSYNNPALDFMVKDSWFTNWWASIT